MSNKSTQTTTDKITKIFYLAALSQLAAAGCGTWLGNPKDPTKPSTGATATSEVSLSFDSQGGGLTLTQPSIKVTGRNGQTIGSIVLSEARVVLGEIKIKTASDEQEARESFNGPFIVDLISHSAAPKPEVITLAGGTYKHIDLKLRKLEDGQANGILADGDPLRNKSIHLRGVYTASTSTATPQALDMSFDLDEQFALNRNAAVTVDTKVTNNIIIAFDLDRWFDFSGREADLTDLGIQTITLDKDSKERSSTVRQAIKENIKGSSKFGKDVDHDGRLGTKEREN